MNKFLFPILLCFFNFSTSHCEAQMKIDRSFFLEAGDSLLLSDRDTSGYNPGPAGMDQWWDFSGLNPKDGNFYQKMEDRASTSLGDSFPNADFAYNTWNLVSLDYYKLKNSGIEWWGAHIPPTVIPFTEPATLLTFDFTFGDSLYDEFVGRLSWGSFTGGRKGWVQSVADGTGTLELAGAIYYDVMRVKHSQYFEDSIDISGSPTIIKYDFENYWWFDDLRKGPILEMVSFVKENTGGFAYDNRIHFNQSASPSAIGELDVHGILVWPNPSNDRFFVSNESDFEFYKVEVWDLGGRLLRSLPASPFGLTSFSLKDLAPGSYVLKLMHSGGETSKVISRN